MHFFVPVTTSAMMDASQVGNCCGVEGGSNRVALSSGSYKLLGDSR